MNSHQLNRQVNEVEGSGGKIATPETSKEAVAALRQIYAGLASGEARPLEEAGEEPMDLRIDFMSLLLEMQMAEKNEPTDIGKAYIGRALKLLRNMQEIAQNVKKPQARLFLATLEQAAEALTSGGIAIPGRMVRLEKKLADLVARLPEEPQQEIPKKEAA